MKVLLVLFLVNAAWAESTEKFKEVMRPHAEVCTKKLDATYDEMNALINLQVEVFTDKVKCLTACALERLGGMKGGKWLGVPAEKRREVYARLFEDDPLRMQVIDIVIDKCDKEADEKFPDKDDGCDVVWDAMQCMWQATNLIANKNEL